MTSTANHQSATADPTVPATLAERACLLAALAALAALRHELRLAEALLASGRPTAAAAVLRAAARSATDPPRVPRLLTASHSTTYGLTGRERDVLTLIARGRTNGQIGVDLFISPKTVSAHVTNILRKLGVTCRVQAAIWAERAGLVDGTPGYDPVERPRPEAAARRSHRTGSVA